jgi:hypothetical protein
MVRSNFRGFTQTFLHLGLFVFTASMAYVAYLNIDGQNWR